MWRHRRVLQRGWPYTKGHRGKLVAVVGLTFLLFVLSLAEPWPLAYLLDQVIDGKRLPSWLDWTSGWSDTGKIMVGVVAMVALAVMRNATSALSEWLQARFELKTVLDYRSELFRHTQKLSLPYLDHQRAGSFIYQINFHAHAMGNLVTALIPLAQSVLTIGGMGYIIFRFDTGLGLIAASVMPFVVASTVYYTRRIEPAIERVRNMEGGSMAIVHESVSMMRVVVAFGRERFEHLVFRRNGEHGVKARVGLTVRQVVYSLVVNLMTVCGTAVVLGYSVHLRLTGQLSTGEVTVVLSYLHAVYQPLESISNQIASLQEQFVNLKLTLNLLDTPIDVVERPGAVPLPPVRGHVVMDGVGFSYAGRAPALTDVTFQAFPGDVVAVVGPTGAGKSTLMSLLTRVVDPHEGAVYVDGVDVRDLQLLSLRGQISVVHQEPLLWARTIRDNISYGRLDASDADVIAAATAANAHDFISALPHGYDTLLGERGSGLSGGERQRISIARAFLKDAPILVLDEPTSSIDSRTEAVILDALDRLMVGRTTFLIAHRLATTYRANRILVLDGGRLAEHGTHEQLYASGGLYRQLWDAQMTSRVAPDDVVELIS